MKILIINDLNDILNAKITHFSLDKGLHLGNGLFENGHIVYFLTTGITTHNKLHFININEVNNGFLETFDLIFLIREALIPNLFENFPIIEKYIVQKNRKTKIVIKSDSIQWILDKDFRKYISNKYGINHSVRSTVEWCCSNFDYICVQTEEFKKDALILGISKRKIIVSNMAISSIITDLSKINNPYDIYHSYCVKTSAELNFDKALLPLYYINNPDKINDFHTTKTIIVYTGRMKTNGGNIILLMRDIMERLGDKYELHIFPGSFFNPISKTVCSATNGNHLVNLRDTVFANSTNVIIHYPYEHKDMYKYLHFAHCGIDFSDMRPKKDICKAGHAKILEYCCIGLPIVCEENINNLFLVNNGKNGIILPYIASVDDYVHAIKNFDIKNVDRKYCQNITYQNENWKRRAYELINQISL